MHYKFPSRGVLSDTHLYEPKDSEGRRAVVPEHEADDAEELSIEATVTETEQEAAEQGQLDTEQQHRQVTARDGGPKPEGWLTKTSHFALFSLVLLCLQLFALSGIEEIDY